MEIFHYETPFNKWLTIKVKEGISSIDFSDNKEEKIITGEIQDLLILFFSSGGRVLPPWEVLNVRFYSHFQIKLYKKVRKIKAGETSSYKELAEKLCCHPRIIGRMLSLNRHALFIPCHRIIRKNGFLGGYKWGRKSKEEIITWETSY